MLKKFLFLLIFLVLVIVGFAGYEVWHWQRTPVIMATERVDLRIPRGSSVKAVADLLEQNQIKINPVIDRKSVV